MAQAEFLSAQQLRMNLIHAIHGFVDLCERDDDVFHSINPESGRRGGADKHTELQGFRKDATKHIQEPLLAAFPRGGSTKDIADFLKSVPDSLDTKNESAGPFIVRLSKELIETLCPDQTEQSLEQEAQDLKSITLSEFSSAAAQIQSGPAWKPEFIERANASGQFDTLDADSFRRFMSALESQAAVYLDEDGMDYEWPDVEDELKVAFTSALQASDASANENSITGPNVSTPKMQP